MALSRGAKGVLVTLVILLAVGGALVGAALWSLGGEPGPGDPVTIEIEEGATAGSVADLLAERGIVRSALAFRLKARSSELDRNLQAGTYELATGMSVDEAIDALLGGPQAPESIRFTVAEGLTVEQILSRLAEQTPHEVSDYRAVLDAGELTLPGWAPTLEAPPAGVREPFEGLLFPETYEVRADASARVVLQRMVDQLAAVVASIPDDQVARASELGLDRYEVLVLASLVEEEAQLAEERATIAGVIYNRILAEMPLQVDATNLYAANEKGRVTEDLLAIDSPYNTYRNLGLPPTPISAPGRAAIEAAFAPEQHDLRFYVKISEEGEHAFAETFEEHQRNVRRFRELQERASESPSPAS